MWLKRGLTLQLVRRGSATVSDRGVTFATSATRTTICDKKYTAVCLDAALKVRWVSVGLAGVGVGVGVSACVLAEHPAPFNSEDIDSDDESDMVEQAGQDVAAFSALLKLPQGLLVEEDFLIAIIALAPVACGLVLVPFLQQRTAFEARLLTRRVNFSLNTIVRDGSGRHRLLIRTLREVDVGTLLPNRVGVNVLLRASTTTVTKASPFVRLPAQHSWTWYNQLLNEVSSLSASGFLAADAGLPVRRRTYVMALTREPDKSVASKKLRVLLVQKKILQRLAAGEIPMPDMELTRHSKRWDTLVKMAAVHFPNETTDKSPRKLDGFGPHAPSNPFLEISRSATGLGLGRFWDRSKPAPVQFYEVELAFVEAGGDRDAEYEVLE